MKKLSIICTLIISVQFGFSQKEDIPFLRQIYKNIGKGLKTNALVYCEVVVRNHELKLSVLKGVHSKEVYNHISSTLELIDTDSLSFEEYEFIFVRMNRDDILKDSLTYKIDEFRTEYSIPKDVHVVKSIYMNTIHCGSGLRKPKSIGLKKPKLIITTATKK